MGAILDGADDISVHAVTIIAGIEGRNEISVAVGLAVEDATELPSAGNGRRRAGQVGGVAIVADGATDSVEQHGSASFDLEDALLHDAGRVVADAVAEIAGFGWIRRHLSSIAVKSSVDEAAFRFGEVNASRWRHHRLRRSKCRRHGR